MEKQNNKYPSQKKSDRVKLKNNLERNEAGYIILKPGRTIDWDAGFELQFGFSYPMVSQDTRIFDGNKASITSQGNNRSPMIGEY